MSKLKTTNILGLLAVSIILTSCAAPKYLPPPTIHYPGVSNICSFGVQNMDEEAKTEGHNLICHYNGFDVVYTINKDFIISFKIINNSNKSLLIDKSKSYVLYNGYSTQLFKDVRSSRSTTFNNVQDAINNVQTNEAGVLMTVPPYSKWELPANETNIRQIKQLPDFKLTAGVYPLTPFDNSETVEFVIPYSYDYAMAEWSTCRNRIFVNSITAEDFTDTKPISEHGIEFISENEYRLIRKVGLPDYTEANRIDAINRKLYKRHNNKVRTSNICWGIITLPIGIGVLPLLGGILGGGCDSHYPPTYGNGK